MQEHYYFICTDDNHFRDKIEGHKYENGFEIKDQMYLVVSSFFPSALKARRFLLCDEYGLDCIIEKKDEYCMLIPNFNWYGLDWKYSFKPFSKFEKIVSYNHQIEIQKKTFNVTHLYRPWSS